MKSINQPAPVHRKEILNADTENYDVMYPLALYPPSMVSEPV